MGSRIHVYKGTTITVTWDAAMCIHAAECVRGLPKVFDTSRKPWVDANAASATAIMGVIERCPSGALKYQFGNGAKSERPAKTNTITVTTDGPLHVRGELEIVRGSDGSVVAKDTRAALCRCGQSANKPFCDRSHAKTGFSELGVVTGPADVKPAAEPAGGSGLRITLRPNGPLRLDGEMQIFDGGGRLAWQGPETALCRCGASKNKPFCDGSHREAGFVAE
ncbi:MAG: CDGSH iron-sulfur domain-containing protein [Burkholderiales bacterium]|nr:CDGSH iron-sulfur domain-containing protein [Burkholderiales bacterium]